MRSCWLVERAGLPRFPAMFAVSTGTGPDDEFALTDLHQQKLLIVAVDAGNFHQVEGTAIDLVLSMSVRLFAVGIPALEPGTWFEDLAQRAMTRTVNMTVSDLPPMTGEDVGRCGFCPSDVPPYPKTVHLPNPAWASRQIAEHRPESPDVVTRVLGVRADGLLPGSRPRAWACRAAPPGHSSGQWLKLLAPCRRWASSGPRSRRRARLLTGRVRPVLPACAG